MWRKEDMEEKPENEVSPELQGAIDEARGAQNLRAYAQTVNVSASYLSQVYNGVRPPSKKLLDHLDLERQVTYVKKKRRWR